VGNHGNHHDCILAASGWQWEANKKNAGEVAKHIICLSVDRKKELNVSLFFDGHNGNCLNTSNGSESALVKRMFGFLRRQVKKSDEGFCFTTIV